MVLALACENLMNLSVSMALVTIWSFCWISEDWWVVLNVKRSNSVAILLWSNNEVFWPWNSDLLSSIFVRIFCSCFLVSFCMVIKSSCQYNTLSVF